MIEERAAHWEGLAPGELAAGWGVPAVELYERIGSTNDAARRLAADGAPTGTVVLAEQQLAGRGRAGRSWSSLPQVGLWLSIVARPSRPFEPGALPLLAGLAVAEALDPFVHPATAQLKWPNDLWTDDRKVGGLLCEGAWEPRGLVTAVVGVGLNVLHREDEFPVELRGSATSVAAAAGRTVARLEVAGAVVRALALALSTPLELSGNRLRALERRDALRGRHVLVTEPASGEPLARGIALGVAPDGALLIRTPSGSVRRVVSGTVRPETTHPDRAAEATHG